MTAEVPPQNLEAEEAVLGAMLLSETAIGAVTEILDAGDFYRGSHGTIYRTCLTLWAKGEPVDAITLANELEERGELEKIGGASRVAELPALVPATANVEHYARIVKETATLRGLIRAGRRSRGSARRASARRPSSSTAPSRSSSTYRRNASAATSTTSGRCSPRASSGSRSSTRRAWTSRASRAASATSTGSRPASSRGTW